MAYTAQEIVDLLKNSTLVINSKRRIDNAPRSITCTLANVNGIIKTPCPIEGYIRVISPAGELFPEGTKTVVYAWDINANNWTRFYVENIESIEQK